MEIGARAGGAHAVALPEGGHGGRDRARSGRAAGADGGYRQLPKLRQLHRGDVLKTDPASLPQPYQVVANLPYYITSAILRHFLESPTQPPVQTGRSGRKP
ncbi:MAG: hypothetical protein WKG07_13375 [Hymenobacter sp.]